MYGIRDAVRSMLLWSVVRVLGTLRKIVASVVTAGACMMGSRSKRIRSSCEIIHLVGVGIEVQESWACFDSA